MSDDKNWQPVVRHAPALTSELMLLRTRGLNGSLNAPIVGYYSRENSNWVDASDPVYRPIYPVYCCAVPKFDVEGEKLADE